MSNSLTLHAGPTGSLKQSLIVALGFGISQPEHVRQVGELADAAVVGSGLVSRIAEVATSGEMATEIHRYVHWLRSGLDCRDV